MLQLYNYYRSSASYRVRIALNYKNIDYQEIPVHLINNGGEQYAPAYAKLNPQCLVPTLQDNSISLTQSLAIIEYLEETHPQPTLLPGDAVARAQIRRLAQLIACEIHPLNNLRVLQYLTKELAVNAEKKKIWYHHWLKSGFDAFESCLQQMDRSIGVCYGDQISLADICLIPQVYNAARFEFPLAAYPLIKRINKYCLTLSCFAKASPHRQTD